MKVEVQDYIKSFNKTASEIMKAIMEFNDDASKDEFYHSCIVVI